MIMFFVDIHQRIKLPFVGSPKPATVWLLNGHPLDLSLEGVTATFDCGNAVLEIEEIDRTLQVELLTD